MPRPPARNRHCDKRDNFVMPIQWSVVCELTGLRIHFLAASYSESGSTNSPVALLFLLLSGITVPLVTRQRLHVDL